MPAEPDPSGRAGVDSPRVPAADAPTEPEPPDRLCVTLVDEGGDWSGFGSAGQAVMQAVAALARNSEVPITSGSAASVVFGSDALVRRLNRTYRGKDQPTNVLSFPFQHPPGAGSEEQRELGDVVLAAETVRSEACERGIDPIHHLQHLVVHGLLHLLGHDHQTDGEAERMERLETEILATIGVADPHVAAAMP